MSAYDQGVEHKESGKSIWYNPFRHKGGPLYYNMWRKGWLSLKLN